MLKKKSKNTNKKILILEFGIWIIDSKNQNNPNLII